MALTSAQNVVGLLFSFDCPAFVLTSADGLAGFRLRTLSEGSKEFMTLTQTQYMCMMEQLLMTLFHLELNTLLTL